MRMKSFKMISAAAVVAFLLDRFPRTVARSLLRKVMSLKAELWPVDEWVNLHREHAIDPDMEIIDPHHHIWDPRYHPKGWPVPLWIIQLFHLLKSPKDIRDQVHTDLSGKCPPDDAVLHTFGQRQLPFLQPYMAEDFLLDIRNRDCGKRGHNVEQTVYLECGWADQSVVEALRPVGEVRMVEQAHAKFPSIANGIVAYANLSLPDVERTLQVYKAIPSVNGIRNSFTWSSDKNIAMTDGPEHASKEKAFRDGFALLERYGLSFDVWMFREQLDDLIDLVKTFPTTTFILDHCAGPLGIKSHTQEGTFPKWEKGVRELAETSENVHAKLSGLAMPLTGFRHDERETPPNSQELAEAWGPYTKVMLDAFGVRRCMFASNFPVDKVSCDYTVMWNAFKLIVKDYSAEDKHALFYDNARRVYKL